MLRLELDGETIANTRFAISPTFAMVESLCHLRKESRPRSPIAAQARQAVSDHKLGLLDALFTGLWDYVPDFITPQPTAPEPTVDDELHAIATTPARRLRWELALLSGGPARLHAHPAVSSIRAALETGEQSFADRLASEIEQYWHALLASEWATHRARMQNDIEARSASTAQSATETLSALHPALRPHTDRQLHLLSHMSAEVPATGRLTLIPMTFALPKPLLVADLTPAPDSRHTMLGYPVITVPGTATTPALPTLLGATRARILSDLQTPRSTTELGQRHYLTPATVSYHLGILHRAGLVTRTRSGYHVLYQQTERGAVLLAGDEPSFV